MIAVYDPPTNDDPYSGGDGYKLVREGIPANLQPLAGRVRQAEAGRRIDAEWRGFVPPEHGDVIREDRVVVVTEGVGPTTYRIRQAGPQGGKWDVEMLLGTTMEVVE